MNKINRKMLLNEKGLSWHIRYSENEETDDCGRWARICYYNGLYIAWINGFVVDDSRTIDIENKLCGKCNFFSVSLDFPTSSNQGGVGGKCFDNIEDAKKYVEDMFNDFKKIINKTEEKNIKPSCLKNEYISFEYYLTINYQWDGDNWINKANPHRICKSTEEISDEFKIKYLNLK